MVRMENPNLDNTTPENLGEEQTQATTPGTGDTQQLALNDLSPAQVDLEQTIPTLLAKASIEEPEPAATVPISIPPNLDQAGDMGETMPTPLQMETEIPPGFDATMPLIGWSMSKMAINALRFPLPPGPET